jgi:hypothetical protein
MSAEVDEILGDIDQAIFHGAAWLLWKPIDSTFS